MRRGHLGANPPSAHRAPRATPIRRGSLRRSRHYLGRKGHARTRQARQPRLDPVAGIRNLPSIPFKDTGISLLVGSPVTATHHRIHQQASPAPVDAEVTLVPRSDPWRRKARPPARDWCRRARRAPRIRGGGEPRRARPRPHAAAQKISPVRVPRKTAVSLPDVRQVRTHGPQSSVTRLCPRLCPFRAVMYGLLLFLAGG